MTPGGGRGLSQDPRPPPHWPRPLLPFLLPADSTLIGSRPSATLLLLLLLLLLSLWLRWLLIDGSRNRHVLKFTSVLYLYRSVCISTSKFRNKRTQMNRNWPPGGEGGGGRRRKGMAAKEEEPEGGGANRASTNRNQPMTRCGNIEKDKQTNKQINKHKHK